MNSSTLITSTFRSYLNLSANLIAPPPVTWILVMILGIPNSKDYVSNEKKNTIKEGKERINGGSFKVEEVDIVKRVVLNYSIIRNRILTSSETCLNLIYWSLWIEMQSLARVPPMSIPAKGKISSPPW